MRPTCGSRLGRGRLVDLEAGGAGLSTGSSICRDNLAGTEAGALSVVELFWMSDCWVTGDEGGERSKIVPACECLEDDSDTGCTSVLTVRYAYRCGDWSDRRTTLGDAGREGGAKAGRM